MDYVATLTFRDSISPEARDAALARRAGWQYPNGIKVIAEYWPAATDFQVVSIFTAEDYGAIMALVLEWEDAFDIAVYPAISADEGLQVGAEAMGKVQRLQGR